MATPRAASTGAARRSMPPGDQTAAPRSNCARAPPPANHARTLSAPNAVALLGRKSEGPTRKPIASTDPLVAFRKAWPRGVSKLG